MGSDESERKRRTFAEWFNDFLEADAAMYAAEYEADDWGSEHDGMPGGDGYWEGGDEIDDGVLETLLIGGLLAGLGWLIYYRQQQQRAAEQRRRAGVEGAQGQGQDQQGGAAAVGVQPEQPPPIPGQQPDGGFFPQPGDPNWGDWVAGGVGM